MTTETFWKYFYEIYEALPRQGPGEEASTCRALRMLPKLSATQRILDIGCGVGMQTLDLAKNTQASILAVDNHAAFIASLEQKIAARGLAHRITAQIEDMGNLPCADHSFDVLWSEGAIFIVGFSKGLSAWRRLIVPGGYLVVSEYCWLKNNPPQELIEEHLDGCEDVGDIPARRNAIKEQGYNLIGDFILPHTGWWDNYYVPLDAVLKDFCARHANNVDALEVAARSRSEIELYKKYSSYFCYSFFVMQAL